jgi:hypothetical protein
MEFFGPLRSEVAYSAQVKRPCKDHEQSCVNDERRAFGVTRKREISVFGLSTRRVKRRCRDHEQSCVNDERPVLR